MSTGPPLPTSLWGRLPPEARAIITALRAEVAELRTRVRSLQQQLQVLQNRLDQNSTNSSRPPSTDPPAVKRRPPHPPSGRKRGGQPGHPLRQRALLPPDRVETIIPSRCRRCGHSLRGHDPHPARHQVIELPKICPEVTEFQLHRLTCCRCGTSTRGELPAGIPPSRQGPRLQSVVALLTGAYRLSKRMARDLCADVLGVPLSPGQLCALAAQTAQATDPVVAELREHARARHANVDETSWRQQRRRAWLWVVVTSSVTVFRIALTRAARVAQ